MTENSAPPKQRRILTGVLAALALAVIAAAAFAVVWVVVLDGTPGPELVPDRVGDDARQSQIEPTPAPVVGIGTQQQEETASGDQEVSLVDIIPSPGIVRFLDTGEKATFEVSALYSDKSRKVVDQTLVSYISGNPTVVQASSDGTITALKIGSTNITVTYQGLTKRVPVTVYGDLFSFAPFDPEMVGQLPNSEEFVVLNRVMIELKSEYTLVDARAVASYINGTILHSFASFPGHLIEFDGLMNSLTDVLNLLEQDNRIDKVYPDDLLEVAHVPPFPSIQYKSNDLTGFGPARVNLREIRRLLQPVKIAVIDDGILFPMYSLDDLIIGSEEANKRETVIKALLDWLSWSSITPINTDDDLLTLFDHIRFDDHRISPDSQDPINLTRDVLLRLQNNKPDTWEQALKKNQAESRFHGTAVSSILVNQFRTANNSQEIEPVIDYELQIHFSGGPGIVEKSDINSKVSLIDSVAVTAALEMIKGFNEKQEHKVSVVNMSLDSRVRKRWCSLISDMSDEVLFVISAGNKGKYLTSENEEAENCEDTDSEDTDSIAEWSFKKNVITVGATDHSGSDRATWLEHQTWWPDKQRSSNFGSAVSIAAPGKKVYYINVESGRVGDGAGTSYAAPLVTAAAAMLKAIKPDATPAQIKQHLIETADKITICRVKTDPCPSSTKSECKMFDGGCEESWNLLRIDRAVAWWAPVAELHGSAHLTKQPTIEFRTPQFTSRADNPTVTLHAQVTNPREEAVTVYLDGKIFPVIGGIKQNGISGFSIRDLSEGSDQAFSSGYSLPSGDSLPSGYSLPSGDSLPSGYSLPKVNIPPGGTIRIDYIFLRTGADWEADELIVHITLFEDDKGENILDLDIITRPGLAPWPRPTAVHTPAPIASPTTATMPTPSGSACGVQPMRDDWDPAYRARTIEPRSFNKPAYSNLRLKYIVANPDTSDGTFSLQTQVLSHIGMFSDFNELPATELNLRGGHGIEVIEPVYPNGGEPRDGEPEESRERRERRSWQDFDYDCDFQMVIYVWDRAGQKLLENYLLTIGFEEGSDAPYTWEK